MNDTADRTTHAVLADGTEVVRYARASHWFLEPSDGTQRRRVSIIEAAAEATKPGTALRTSGYGNGPLMGGRRFHALVTKGKSLAPVSV